MAEKNEIEEDEEIADNRKWIDSDIWTLLEGMEINASKVRGAKLIKSNSLEKGVRKLPVIFPLQKYSCYFFSQVAIMMKDKRELEIEVTTTAVASDKI
jgi:hypothetical protein